MTRWILLAALAIGAGCGDDDGAGDAGGGGDASRADGGGGDEDGGGGVPDGSTMSCADDAACDDGLFCNGSESCNMGSCLSGIAPECDDGLDCTTDACSDEIGACTHDAIDADGDEHTDADCGGDDCDDGDPMRFPGNAEVCDAPINRDEDCNPATFGVRDADMDGEPDAQCCNGDCDDARSGVHPGATEACNGRDDDCDGLSDEDVLVTYYRDADMDSFGSAALGAETMTGCSRPTGFSDSHDDCDDSAGGINPAATERCDMPMLDEDCDGERNEGCGCVTGVPVSCSRPGRCLGASQACVDGMLGPCSVTPEPETCDTEDDDCDGTVDEGVTRNCWPDTDGDTFAAAGATPVMACTCGAMQTTTAPGPGTSDCAPADMAVHPGATESCNRMDDNCSSGGGADPTEDADMDMHSPPGAMCTGGYMRDDCLDSNGSVFPGQTMYFPTDRGDGSFDYDCDMMETRQYNVLGTCMAMGLTCTSTPGYMGSIPACGDDGDFLASCARDASGCMLRLRRTTQPCR